MNVTRKQRVTTIFTVERELKISLPDFDGERGLRYWPDMDELAAKSARSDFDAATAAIRASMKSDDAPVALSIERRGESIWAVFSATSVRNS